MARNQRTYDKEYKAEAVKLAQEIGGAKAAAGGISAAVFFGLLTALLFKPADKS